MDKIVTLDTHYVGRLLRTSGGNFKINFYVSEDNINWDLKISFPVEYSESTSEFSQSLDKKIQPLSSDIPNNGVYEHLAERTGPVEVRVEERYRFYKLTADCKKCEIIYPDSGRMSKEGFVVASGSIEDFE